MQSVDVVDLQGLLRCGAGDELRIPVPIPAIAAAAQVGGEPVQIGRAGPVRVVGGDRVGDLVEGVEAGLHLLGHEREYPVGAGDFHVRHDVDQHHRAGGPGHDLPGQQHRGETAQRGAHQYRVRRQRAQHLIDVGSETDQTVVAAGRPIRSRRGRAGRR